MSADLCGERKYFMEDKEVDIGTISHSTVSIIGLFDIWERP